MDRGFEMKLCRFALAGALIAPLANPASADWLGSGKPQTPAGRAEYECAALYYGSTESLAATIIAGAIGNTIRRSMYIDDCMKKRGFQQAAAKKSKTAAGSGQKKN
jgi:hypothetical protein